jgi:cytochrome c-type biogenesis protein CcmH/NrfG
MDSDPDASRFLIGTSPFSPNWESMTDQNVTREDRRADRFYTRWIIRGGIVLAIVIAVLAFFSTGNYPDRDAPKIAPAVSGPPP